MNATPSPSNTPPLRHEDLVAWLGVLPRVFDFPFCLVGPEGRLIYKVGDRPESPRIVPIQAHQAPVALLEVPHDAHADQVAALAETVTSCAEARVTIADMARSLAAAWKESNFMYQLSLVLQDTVDVEPASEVIVGQLARVLKASHVSLHLLRQERWRHVASFDRVPGEAPMAPLPAGVLSDEQTVVPTRDGCRVYQPLVASGEPLGMICLAGPESLGLANTLKFLGSVATQVTQALRLRSLIALEVENAQIQRELALAAELQRSLLPQASPAFPGVEVAARCLTAKGVGGDAYDFFAHQGGLDLVVADVSGHGITAGLIMSSFLGGLRTQDRGVQPLVEIAAQANRHMCHAVGKAGHFVTALYARVEPGARDIGYTCMGHPAPLLWRRGTVSAMPVEVRLPVGLLPDESFVETRMALEPGDRVLFYTDGLTEARSPDGTLFGQDALAAAFGRLAPEAPPARIIEGLFGAISAYSHGQAALDDQTAIVFAVEAP